MISIIVATNDDLLIGKKDSSNILEDYLTNRNNKSRDNTNLQCRSIEDVLDVLSTLKR